MTSLLQQPLEDFDQDYDESGEDKDSVMMLFAKAIMKQLQDECRTQRQTVKGKLLPVVPKEEKWLLSHLRQNVSGFNDAMFRTWQKGL